MFSFSFLQYPFVVITNFFYPLVIGIDQIKPNLSFVLIILSLVVLISGLSYSLGFAIARKRNYKIHQRNLINHQIISLHHCFLTQPRTEFFNSLLDGVLSITDSEFGFIAEVKKDEYGKAFLETLTISNIAWDKASEELVRPEGMIFRNLDNLLGSAVETGEVVRSNLPMSHPASRGLPPGHPELTSFIGIPLKQEGRVIGILALANRPGGYLKSHLRQWAALFDSCTEFLSEELRKAALVRSERDYKKLFDEVPCLYLVTKTDHEGEQRIANCNNRFLEELNLSVPEVMGQKLKKFCFNDDEGLTFDKKMDRVKVTLKGRGGALIQCELDLEPNYDTDRNVCGARMLFSTTGSKQLLDQVLRFVKEAPVPIFSVDASLNVTSWNNVMSEKTGYEKSEVMGKPLPGLLTQRCSEDIFERLSRLSSRSVVEEWQLEFRSRVRGYIRIMASNSMLHLPEHGRIDAVVFVGQDTTDSDILKMRSENQEYQEAIRDMTAAIAHQINNTLTVVLSGLKSKNEDIEAEDIDDAKRAIAETREMIHKLEVIGLEQLEGERKRIELNFFLQEFRKKLPVAIEFRQQESSGIEILANEIELEMAIQALVDNANSAGGNLNLVTRVCEVTEIDKGFFRHLSSGRYVMISVFDTGLGISQSDVDRVKRPFFTSKELGFGAGLGLAIVDSFARRNSGVLTIRSDKNLGTQATICLPVANTTARSPRGQANDLSGQRCLIIVDALSLQKYLLYALASHGGDVTRCRSAHELDDLSFDDSEVLVVVDAPNWRKHDEFFQSFSEAHPNISIFMIEDYEPNIEPKYNEIRYPILTSELIDKLNLHISSPSLTSNKHKDLPGKLQ